MSIYHFALQIISRKDGRSTVACAAYRSATKLYDESTQTYKDYGRKQNVTHTDILLPKNAPAEYADRQKLWNSVEAAEKRSDAQLAREFNVALPNELSLEEQNNIMREYGQYLVDQGMCVDYAIHSVKGNNHGHYMVTMRALDENGKWMPKQKRVVRLDENGNRIPMLDKNGNQKKDKKGAKRWEADDIKTTNWDEEETLNNWREQWAIVCNAHLAPELHIDHRSNEARGLDELPTVHLGVAASQMEKKGIRTELGDKNRKIKKHNAYIAQVKAELNAEAKAIMAKQAQIREEQDLIARRYVDHITAVGEQQQAATKAIAVYDREAQQRAERIRAAIGAAQATVQGVLGAGDNPSQKRGKKAAEVSGTDRAGVDAHETGRPVQNVTPLAAAWAKLQYLHDFRERLRNDYYRDRTADLRKYNNEGRATAMCLRQQDITNILHGARYYIISDLEAQGKAIKEILDKDRAKNRAPINEKIAEYTAKLEQENKWWERYEAQAGFFDRHFGDYDKQKADHENEVQRINKQISSLQTMAYTIKGPENLEKQYYEITQTLSKINNAHILKEPTLKTERERSEKYLKEINIAIERHPEYGQDDNLIQIDRQWRGKVALMDVDNVIRKELDRQHNEKVLKEQRIRRQTRELQRANQRTQGRGR